MMDTHGGKTSTSECNEAALLHFCYIYAMICMAGNGHKVDEMTTREADEANLAPIRSSTW